MQNILYSVKLPALNYFGDTYSCSGYGSSAYNSKSAIATGANCQTAATTGGSLANTGLAVAMIVTAACAIGLLAILVRVWRRPKKSANKNIA